jgi:preprotein translocase subunit Sec63
MQENLGGNSKIVIPSRDSIRLRINCNEIKTIIRDFNMGKKRMKRVDVYVIDSLGITTITKSRSIKKNLRKMIKKDLQIEKAHKKTEQEKLSLEKRAKRKENRYISRTVRKEKLNNLWLRIKAKLPRKNKD